MGSLGAPELRMQRAQRAHVEKPLKTRKERKRLHGPPVPSATAELVFPVPVPSSVPEGHLPWGPGAAVSARDR